MLKEDEPIGNVSELFFDYTDSTSPEFFYVVDRIGNKFLKFDKDGSFIARLGLSESGPGAYSRISDVYYYAGVFYIADIKKHQIHKLSNNGEFIGSFRLSTYNCKKLLVAEPDTIISYNPVVSDLGAQWQIHIQDTIETLVKFVEPTLVAQKAYPLPNRGIVYDQSRRSIFHINAHEYKIYDYSLTGELKQVYTPPGGFSECKSLPEGFQLQRNYTKKYMDRFRSKFTWIDDLYLLEPDILIVEYITSIKPNKKKFDLISTSGHFLSASITPPDGEKLIGTYNDYLITMRDRELSDDGSLTPINISLWKIKRN